MLVLLQASGSPSLSTELSRLRPGKLAVCDSGLYLKTPDPWLQAPRISKPHHTTNRSLGPPPVNRITGDEPASTVISEPAALQTYASRVQKAQIIK